MASGVSFSGATVHFVDEEYDTGPILAQHSVPVLPDDSAEQVAARVLVEVWRCLGLPFQETGFRAFSVRAIACSVLCALYCAWSTFHYQLALSQYISTDRD